MSLAQVRIVGTGLIGTSIALGLAQKGIRIVPIDSERENELLARDLLSNALGSGESDLTILATPPAKTLEALKLEFIRNPNQVFIDTGSTKSNLVSEVQSFPELADRFLGTHPMAGRERGGARAAQSDLFQGRAWFVTPTSSTNSEVKALAHEVISLLGATSYELDAHEHDVLLAAISHLPQAVSSALASSLNEDLKLDLAGQGLRDMVRIASSDPDLWSEIFFANKGNLIKALDDFHRALDRIKSAISTEDKRTLVSIFEEGATRRSQVSGKHGAIARKYVELLIVIDDRPGQLSRLFQECADVNANIEDLSIEHSPGQPTGLISLSFSSEDAERVMLHLRQRSWKVHQA